MKPGEKWCTKLKTIRRDMLSVATMICNGIPSGISERGRETPSPSGTGTALIYLIHRSRCWREHTPRIGNILGFHQQSSRSKNNLQNNAIFLILCCIIQDLSLPLYQMKGGTPYRTEITNIKPSTSRLSRKYDKIWIQREISNCWRPKELAHRNAVRD